MLLKTESDSLIGVTEFSERHGFLKIDKNLSHKIVYECKVVYGLLYIYNMDYIILYREAGYKTLLLAVYKTSLFSSGPNYVVVRPHFCSKFPSGCLQNLTFF